MHRECNSEGADVYIKSFACDICLRRLHVYGFINAILWKVEVNEVEGRKRPTNRAKDTYRFFLRTIVS